MLHQASLLSCVEELTVVVVGHPHAEKRESRARSPETCVSVQTFAQGPTESALSFDERLRECLGNLHLLQSLGRAVLVCTPEPSDRETLRRLRLVAARIKPGGLLTLAYHTPALGPTDVHFADRLGRLARFASLALGSHRVTVDVLPVSQLEEESAPLSAVWQRLQRQRGAGGPSGGEPPSNQEPSAVPPVTPNVTRMMVCHQRKVKSAAVAWTERQAPAPVTPVLFPAVIPRR